MIVSCRTWGWEWGSDAMVETLEELVELGVNWVAIHPYAYIYPDGRVESIAEMRGSADDSWLRRPIREAHKLGLKICIKPHIAYWGSRFKWRGEIEFESSEQRKKFFASYAEWLSSLVERCGDADAFVVGTELDRMASYEDEWRDIIACLRDSSGAALTYGANWTDYEKIEFWDALDAIGIQAYFPLLDASIEPKPELLEEAWRTKIDSLAVFARKWDRPIVFTELGYDVSTEAACRPWVPGNGTRRGESVQRMCLEAALKTLGGGGVVSGAFLWKWFPGEAPGENYLLSTPPMQRLIRSFWNPGRDRRPGVE